MSRYLIVVIVALFLIGACGHPSSSQTPPAHTGVVGRVMIEGGPAPGTARPYPDSKVKVIDPSGTVVATATPKANGTYVIDLPPGHYRVEAVPTGGNPGFIPVAVAVLPGSYAKVDVIAQVP